MKKMDYYYQNLQMGDLLESQGVCFGNFTNYEVRKLRKKLENYLSSGSEEQIEVNLKTFILVIMGADEAALLLNYIPE